MDVHSPEVRSFNMSRIKGKDTQPELLIRRRLWASGYRYRLHRTDLSGMPDITLAKYKAVLFVHGCFWHRHGCRLTTTPSSRPAFWLAKFEQNVERDKRNVRALLEDGWRVMIIWECSIRGRKANLEAVGLQIMNFLTSDISLAEATEDT